jgi:glutamyl-tRNA reductase
MHIYQFRILKPKSTSVKREGWIKDCYQKFNKSEIKELFIVRQHDQIDIFAVGTDLNLIIPLLNEFFSQKLKTQIQDTEKTLVDHFALIYFFEILMGKNDGLPADPRVLLQIRQEFNLALDEGAVGSILTRMYRQGEKIGNDLQNNPIVLKNCIVYADVLLDIAKKISGNLDNFQFIFIGIKISEMQCLRALGGCLRYL